MNKKFSTFLTAGLLVAGSFVGSAWAADQVLGKITVDDQAKAITDADKDKQYVLQSYQYWNGSSYVAHYNSVTYVVVAERDANDNVTFKLVDQTKVDDENVVVWTVTPQTSASGEKDFSFSSSFGALKVDYTKGTETKTYEGRYATTNDGNLLWMDGSTKYEIADGTGLELIASVGNPKIGAYVGHIQGFKLLEVKDADAGDELNDLYNGKGFNFTAGKDVEGNVFNDGKVIFAEKVTKQIKISENTANGKDLIIPVGTYFFTDKVMDGKNIDWLASTVIVADPVNTVETTVTDRENGQGFQMRTAKVSDFIFEQNASDYKVGDLPIVNAAFDVAYDNNSKYGVSLKDFYYKKDANAADTDKLTKADGTIYVGVLTFSDGAKYVATSKTASKAFTFVDSQVKDGKELLNTEKVAAVYNIKFVEGNQHLNGKYLTVGTDGSNFNWIATAYDITNVNVPAYQFTITNVEKAAGQKNNKDAKYVNVTFTNREANESFTVQLYPDAEAGDDCYTLAGFNEKVDAVNVTRNGYGTTVKKSQDVDNEVVVKLIPATVDEYAGFANLDNKSIRTIRFARDKFDTSNAWYTAVYNNSLKKGSEDYFVEEAIDAAPFQLIKSKKASTIARTFVYYNETTEDIDDVAKGDKVSAYSYKLQYINDGTAQDLYLTEGSSAIELKKATAAPNEYFIKENADGSVSFIRKDGNSFSSMNVTGAGAKQTIGAQMQSSDDAIEYVLGSTRADMYKYEFKDSDLRAYLDSEVANVSWPAKDGHVTMLNVETASGNYISMAENRDGIVTSAADVALYLTVADKSSVAPKFFISKGINGGNIANERMFMFNPADSVSYPVNMDYDPIYQIGNAKTKAIFKAGTLNEKANQMTINVKGEDRKIAKEADNEGVWAGLDRFMFQIVLNAEGDAYNVRQVDAAYVDSKGKFNADGNTLYLASLNDKLFLTTDKKDAMPIEVKSVSAPTANESIEAEGVKVLGQNGSVVVLGAAGKNVTVSTVLGKRVASQVIASDNATIAAPAGVVFVTVDGETTKVVVK